MLWSDNQLMALIAEGDREAFALLHSRYQLRLRSLFASFGCRFDEAQDLAQETLLRLWLARADYEARGEFKAYLFKIARNCWLRRLRQGKCRPREEALPADETEDWRIQSAMHRLRAADQTPDEAFAARYRKWRLQWAVGSLPESHRGVLVLVHLQGLKYAEAAQELGIPIGTVKSRLSAALKMLRERLKGELL